ncbi:1-acyl-sn-glycerol-3-phosphate acyltransferase [bacterium]|nr:MAG: 1-acyl-sn-glycerol-3-phosphate acyltransferase [bacterium]
MSQDRAVRVYPVLSMKADARRLRGLHSATGIGPWFGYRVFRQLILLVATTRMKGRIVGLERLPQPTASYYPPRYRRSTTQNISDYPFVVAPNHQHVLDIPLTGLIPRPMMWPSKPDFVRWWWLKRLNQRMGCVPFMRDVDWVKQPHYQGICFTKEEMKEVLDTALRRGQPAVVYPQGTRRDDDNLFEAKLGAMYASLRADVPLVPLAIYGVGKADEHRQTKILHRYYAVAVVMDPLQPADYAGDNKTRAYAMLQDWQQAIEQGRNQARQIIETM